MAVFSRNFRCLENLKSLKLVENQTGKNIKVLRTDNGGELGGKLFDQFGK